MTIHAYYASPTVCRDCELKSRCTRGKERRVKRWEHEDVLDAMEEELRNTPDAMPMRARTSEHPFGTLKRWMGLNHFLMKRLKNARTETIADSSVFQRQTLVAKPVTRPSLQPGIPIGRDEGEAAVPGRKMRRPPSGQKADNVWIDSTALGQSLKADRLLLTSPDSSSRIRRFWASTSRDQ